MGDKGTLLALVFTIFLQAATGIWWASRLQTRQEIHSEWIAQHQSQQEDYPVLRNRVGNLEENTGKLIDKMDRYIDELRQLKGGTSEQSRK